MVELKACLNQSKGIKFSKFNNQIIKGYMKMAEDSLGTMQREKDKNLIFAVSACYYSMYYSLYSILQKIGIKCEIHSCSIKFMELYLKKFYSKEDCNLIQIAFSCRNNLQYYVDRNVNKSDLKLIFFGARMFVSKSKIILSKINKEFIGEIIKELEKLK